MSLKYLRWFLGLITLVSLSLIIWFKFTIPWRWILFILLCFALSLIRLIKGPTPADRAVATDIFGIFIIGTCAILAIYTQKSWYIDIAIAWALQSFIGVLALAKFLEGKRFDE